jgi:hypothetical protein
MVCTAALQEDIRQPPERKSQYLQERLNQVPPPRPDREIDPVFIHLSS